MTFQIHGLEAGTRNAVNITSLTRTADSSLIGVTKNASKNACVGQTVAVNFNYRLKLSIWGNDF